MELDFSRALKTSTFDAHRLIALAGRWAGRSSPRPRSNASTRRHFQEGLALDDHGVLLRVGAEAGLDERRVASVLAGEDYADAVRADEARAEELGVTGVPFVLANEHLAVAGLRSVDGYLQTLHEAAAPTSQS